VVRLRRGSQAVLAHGWARDISESGLGAFIARDLVLGEQVTIHLRLGDSANTEIAARVVRQVGTQYGFQFTALTVEQRIEIQFTLKR